MNKTRKLFIAILAVITLALGAFAFGCKKDDKLTVTFETNGGTAIASVQLAKGEEYDLPKAERTGYEFDGWYLASDFSGESVAKITVNENTTVYAKWTKLYVVNFELNGGSMNENTVYVKAGGLVSAAVGSLQPTKADHKFGVWQIDGKDLSSSYVMPEKDITLTAKYMTKYTVVLYRERADEEGKYDKEEQEIVDYAYAGTVPQKDFGGVGYVLDSTAAGSKPLAKISENVSENAFILYYKRGTFTVRFNTNYPDGKENDVKSESVRYGAEIEVPYNYVATGYYLAGWAESSTSKTVEYEADFISSALYNGDESDKGENSKITPSKNMTLYGVWVKGYSDMFDGNDYLFVSATETNTVYLSRAEKFFKGTYNAQNSTFTFADSEGLAFLDGKIFSDGTFAYNEPLRAKTYTNYINGKGLNTNITLLFDNYNGLTYNDNATGSYSKGTYTFDSKGYCVATFTEGNLSGEEMYIRITSATIDGVRNNVFVVRNDEELALGTLYRGVFSNGSMMSYPDGYYNIKLDGFGTATFYQNPLAFANYGYIFDSEKMLLTLTSSGSVVGTFRVYKDPQKGEQGQYDYVSYNSAYDKVFESADKSATLTLDGSFNAVYKKGNQTIEGIYLSSDSVFSGGKIISLKQGNKTIKSLLITSKQEQVGVDDKGSPKYETVYSFEERADGYAEYYYRAADNTYRAPLVVINDTAVGHMTVYGYTISGGYEKISEGTFTESNGVYNYTMTSLLVGGITKTEQASNGQYVYYHIVDGEETIWMVAVEDIVKLKALEFGIGSTVIGSDVYETTYWYTATIGEETKNYVTEFTRGNSTLTRIGGMMSFSEEGKTVLGTYATENGITTITAYNADNGSTESVYVKLDEEAKTFVKLEYSPYTMSAIVKGNVDNGVTLTLNGDGTATYTEGENKYEGTVTTSTDKTETGATIMEFTSDEKSFRYLPLSGNGVQYFAKDDDKTFKTEYFVDGVGRIVLDGFFFQGSFISVDGDTYTGRTYTPADNVLAISTESGILYFDITGDTFTKRGAEYGTYNYYDNNINKNIAFRFDGYGKLTVLKTKNGTIVTDDDGKEVVLGNGTYAYDAENATYTVTYDKEKITGVIKGRAFAKLHTEYTRFYINDEDWAIIEIDASGNAVKYSKKGVKESGAYTIITDNLFFFINSSSTDACLYRYDYEKGTAVQLSRATVSYYTVNFESFNFTEYGFAQFGSSDAYYYDVTDEGGYIIYRRPSDDETAQNVNDYGFIVEELGILEGETPAGDLYYKTFNYHGKEYFYNNGYSLQFDREKTSSGAEDTTYGIKQGSGDNQYSLYLRKLNFQPSGEDEFEVTCTATFGGYPQTDANGNILRDENGNILTKDFVIDGTIIRNKLENGEYETYFVLYYNYIGYFRLDLDVVFRGGYDASGKETDNAGTYEVTSLKRVVTAPAYQYLQNYYERYMTTGSVAGLENDIGTVEFIYVYGADGEEIESEKYFRGDFGTASKITDINGNTFKIEKGDFEEQSNGLFIVTFTVPDYEKKEGEVTDGYTYRLYTYITRHSAFRSSYGYRVYAYTRVQDNLVSGEYTVTAERMIYTETAEGSYPAGSVFNISLKKNGENVDYEIRLTGSTAAYLITRTYAEDGKTITGTKYYAVSFTEKASGEIGDEGVKLFESATVTEMAIKTYYGADGVSFFDVTDDENGQFMLIFYKGSTGNGSYYIPSATTDGENGTKIVTTTDGSVFEITIDGDSATIKKTA